jgi:hypothetical protein
MRASFAPDADKNANLFGVRERRMQFVESANEKVADQTIKIPRVVAQQYAKSLVQTLTVFVRDKCAVRGHISHVRLRRKGRIVNPNCLRF